MKTIKLLPTEFYKFRQLCFSLGILFSCFIAKGVYTITADSSQLTEIGY